MITALILIALAFGEIARWNPAASAAASQDDFNVYLTAAHLVREHRTVEIYDAADTGADPQMRFAPPASLFQQTASSLGAGRVRLYVYPPTLADLLVPFTFLSLKRATVAWLMFNTLAIFVVGCLCLSLFRRSPFALSCIGLFIAALCFRPNIWAIEQGQISSFLLLLWTAGIVFYVKGHVRASAAIFALAVAIKLTPVLVLVPLLLWREWKWARWFAISLVAILGLLCVVNGPRTLADFVLHVAPPMSKGFSANANISLPTELPAVYWACTRVAIKMGLARDFFASQKQIPWLVVVLTKVATAAILFSAAFFIYKVGPLRSGEDRAKVLAMVALLSLYCSPVAWQSAYGITFLVALFLWKDAYQNGASTAELLLLVFCTLEFSFFFDTMLLHVARGVALNVSALIAPVSGCVLIVHTLRKMAARMPAASPRDAPRPFPLAAHQ